MSDAVYDIIHSLIRSLINSRHAQPTQVAQKSRKANYITLQSKWQKCLSTSDTLQTLNNLETMETTPKVGVILVWFWRFAGNLMTPLQLANCSMFVSRRQLSIQSLNKLRTTRKSRSLTVNDNFSFSASFLWVYAVSSRHLFYHLFIIKIVRAVHNKFTPKITNIKTYINIQI